VLAKHDEKYTPPEVADAMNKAYELKQQEQAQ
jgi:cytochrome c-type biogenesis protein CcmE